MIFDAGEIPLYKHAVHISMCLIYFCMYRMHEPVKNKIIIIKRQVKTTKFYVQICPTNSCIIVDSKVELSLILFWQTII